MEIAKPLLISPDLVTICPNGLEQIKQTFGNIYKYIDAEGKLKPSWETEHLGRIRLPFSIPLSWDHKTFVRNIYCHNKLVPVFKSVFESIVSRHLKSKITSYGGCYNYRNVRNGVKLSTHSWGIAIDLNTETNRVGTPGDMDPRLVQVFEEHGFVWGGNWIGKNCDPMHFQYCDGY